MKRSAGPLQNVVIVCLVLVSCLVSATEIHAFMSRYHRAITNEVLHSSALNPKLQIQLPSGFKTYRFNQRNIDLIADRNVDTDLPPSFSVVNNHCTADRSTEREDLRGCAETVRLREADALTSIFRGFQTSYLEGLKYFGTGLHTVQDFCAHTNYVDLLAMAGEIGVRVDVNRDGWVDGIDILAIAVSFTSTPGDPNWLPNADVNMNGIVDQPDLDAVEAVYATSFCPGRSDLVCSFLNDRMRQLNPFANWNGNRRFELGGF